MLATRRAMPGTLPAHAMGCSGRNVIVIVIVIETEIEIE